MPKMVYRCNWCNEIFSAHEVAVMHEETHIKNCTNPSCEREFIDTTKNRTKKYCCEACQNLAKQQRFRDRRKGELNYTNKIWATHKSPGIITQIELIEYLKELGISISTQTIRTREKQGVVRGTYRSGSGRPGRSVFYPSTALFEHYAASKMFEIGAVAKDVAIARSVALQLLENAGEENSFNPKELALGKRWIKYYLECQENSVEVSSFD